MVSVIAGILKIVLFALCLASLAYLAVAIARVRAFGKRLGSTSSDYTPPVTVLKPLCGLEPGLRENLRSFCNQDYPGFQIVFGVADPDDPAAAVARDVMAEFPWGDFTLVAGGGACGINRKVANLANMFPHATHELIVIADSDMRVGENYLRAVVEPFADPKVGAVTCLYSGTAAGGLPSTLGALFINDWFFPSVLVALTFQRLRYCFGATMAVRRGALEAIGGFEELSAYLADDYMLGHLVSREGYEVRLASFLTENIVHEPGFKALLRHELRWARTIRACQPAGYAFSFIGNNTISLAAIYLLLTGAAAGWVLLAGAVSLRLALHGTVRSILPSRGHPVPWLLPLRDVLCLLTWAMSFFGRTISWRESDFQIRPDGRLDPIRKQHGNKTRDKSERTAP